jgi:glyoxylase-like metal-dependent hydrolase (beta-lactamase superfamily II)
MKMHVLCGGRLRMKKGVYLPDAERHEKIDLPVSCYLLRHAHGNVLFDTGCHPSVQTDAEARWGSMAKAMVPIAGPDDNLISQLGVVGLTPLDIDVVINSHFHSDHCGCNEFFKNATVLCHTRELQAAQAEDGVQNGFLPIDWKQPLPLQTIDAEHDLFGDNRIVLLPMPGHTPGMTTALVELSQDGAFLLASDSVPLRANMEMEINPRNTWNAEQSMHSMQEIRRIEDRGVTVLFGHDAEQWETLRKSNDAYQ